jgi:dienelactone hydrolase
MSSRHPQFAWLLASLLAVACWQSIPQVWAEEPALYPPATEVKAAFLKLLDRPRVPLDAKVLETKPEKGDLTSERISLASQKRADGQIERIPALLVRPTKPVGRLPAVIVLHGTGGNKEGQRGWLDKLAAQGIIGLAIDARYHGERSGGAKGAEAYQAAIARAWKASPEEQEHPFYYDTCWDLWRTVDYLATREDVDPERIGMIGFSMGGIQTWLAAAVDDRVKVVVPAIAAQSFRWSLENNQWQGRARTIKVPHEQAAEDLGKEEVDAEVCRALWNKIIPGMLDRFDCPSMLRLFAGRPMLIVSGETDPNCPLGGAKLAFASAEAAYRKAGAVDKLKIDVATGVAHKVTDEQQKMALDWFVKWLK